MDEPRRYRFWDVNPHRPCYSSDQYARQYIMIRKDAHSEIFIEEPIVPHSFNSTVKSGSGKRKGFPRKRNSDDDYLEEGECSLSYEDIQTSIQEEHQFQTINDYSGPYNHPTGIANIKYGKHLYAEVYHDDLIAMDSRQINEQLVNYSLISILKHIIPDERKEKMHLYPFEMFRTLLDSVQNPNSQRLFFRRNVQFVAEKWSNNRNLFEMRTIVIPAYIDKKWFLVVVENPKGFIFRDLEETIECCRIIIFDSQENVKLGMRVFHFIKMFLIEFFIYMNKTTNIYHNYYINEDWIVPEMPVNMRIQTDSPAYSGICILRFFEEYFRMNEEWVKDEDGNIDWLASIPSCMYTTKQQVLKILELINMGDTVINKQDLNSKINQLQNC